MTNEDCAYEKVCEIISQELNIPLEEVTPQLGLYCHPKWDSLSHVRILLRLETECNLKLSEFNIDTLTTVNLLIEKLEVKND